MLSFIRVFNLIIFFIFTVCYLYQFVYVLVTLFGKRKRLEAEVQHRYAVIIAARNEREVIAHLIASIKKQKYPEELVDVFVVADNCTDDTAEVARGAGAHVYVRENRELVGKGYALDYAFKNIANDFGDKDYEGYFIFDADNLLDENYIAEMNRTFDSGYRIVTSYRNSKNYDTNWISAGSSLWFLKEARYLNNARMILKSSCAVSGTGFLVHADIVNKNNGWKHHLLTEDIEFSIDNVIAGEVIGYCDEAMLYDEQPTEFEQSWNQRLRWAKGFYQVVARYGWRLFKGIFGKKPLACYDMLMTVLPAMGISVIGVIVNLVFMVLGFMEPGGMNKLIIACAMSVITTAVNFYLILFFFGAITTISEWKKIRAKAEKKIIYMFTFPVFILTYVPIAIVALFRKIEWTPIKHSVSKTIEELQQ